jgi:poly(hydroxyalkanoate) granule-associated protein
LRNTYFEEKIVAKSKSKSKQRVSEIAEQLDHVFLAGLGALSNAQKKGTETFDVLVKDGEKFRKETSKKTENLIDEVQGAIREMSDDAQSKAEGLLDRVRDRSKLVKLQSVFDKRVADAMDRLNVPSKNDIDKINKKLNKILRAIESKDVKAPTKKAAATKRATAARKKTSGKKTPVASPTEKSEPKAA